MLRQYTEGEKDFYNYYDICTTVDFLDTQTDEFNPAELIRVTIIIEEDHCLLGKMPRSTNLAATPFSQRSSDGTSAESHEHSGKFAAGRRAARHTDICHEI